MKGKQEETKGNNQKMDGNVRWENNPNTQQSQYLSGGGGSKEGGTVEINCPSGRGVEEVGLGPVRTE